MIPLWVATPLIYFGPLLRRLLPSRAGLVRLRHQRCYRGGTRGLGLPALPSHRAWTVRPWRRRLGSPGEEGRRESSGATPSGKRSRREKQQRQRIGKRSSSRSAATPPSSPGAWRRFSRWCSVVSLGSCCCDSLGWKGCPPRSIALTGLAVGSGTKPLHDLISDVQKAKEQREDPPEKKAA